MMAGYRRILVAEDNPALGQVIRFNLERAGFDVQVAGNGEEATQLIAGQTFDLVITDLQMPHMDGEQLCRHIRTVLGLQELPIVVCSAKGLEIDTARLMVEYRLEQVLLKPFSPTELVDIVTSVLGDRSAIPTSLS